MSHGHCKCDFTEQSQVYNLDYKWMTIRWGPTMCLARSFGRFQGNEALPFCIVLCVLFRGNFHTREGVRSVISTTESGFIKSDRTPPWHCWSSLARHLLWSRRPFRELASALLDCVILNPHFKRYSLCVRLGYPLFGAYPVIALWTCVLGNSSKVLGSPSLPTVKIMFMHYDSLFQPRAGRPRERVGDLGEAAAGSKDTSSGGWKDSTSGNSVSVLFTSGCLISCCRKLRWKPVNNYGVEYSVGYTANIGYLLKGEWAVSG